MKKRLQMKSKAIMIYYKTMSVFKRLQFKKRNNTVYIGRDVQIIGVDKTIIGDNVTISDRTWINVNNRQSKDVFMSIGNNSFIGRNNFFTIGKSIELHDWFFSSVDCKLIGSSHSTNPLNPYLFNSTEQKDTIIIESNVFLGAGVTVIGNVKIGYGSIVGADSLVTKSIPPLSIVIGRPAVVRKRYDLIREKWVDADAYDDEAILPSEKDYLEMINKSNLSRHMFYHASTCKGWL